MTDDIDEIVRDCRRARELMWVDALEVMKKAADALERLKAERDGRKLEADELIKVCRDAEAHAEAAEKERDELRKQLVRAKAALEECCHMAGAHTETDAEDWLCSIREYSRKQLLALTDENTKSEAGFDLWCKDNDVLNKRVSDMERGDP